MSRWTTPKDLEYRLRREWGSGRILAARLHGDSFFPYIIPLKHPSGKELSNSFEQAKEWIETLVSRSKLQISNGYELKWQEINHRQLGKNKIPVAAIFSREIDGLSFIGKTKEADQFQYLREKILKNFPELLQWLIKKPILVLAYAQHWTKILRVLRFLKANPRPAIYIRQLDIAGVDTKFVEKQKKILSELLDVVLPVDAIDQHATGSAGFEQRYGFLAKPVQVRFRVLDPNIYIHGLSDLQIPVDDFARLELPVERIFITENIINGLVFPKMKQSMVIFGLGYGLDRLAGINWLKNKKIYYWGDIDTHGFAMLDQVRSYFPQTLSLLMDRSTLLKHKVQWGDEKTPIDRELPHLNEAEYHLYNDLINNRFTEALRFEQEKIPYVFLESALKELGQTK